MILIPYVGNLHGSLEYVEGKEQLIPQYVIILQGMAQNTKGMVVVNSTVDVAPAQGQKKEKLLPGERL